MSLPNRISRGFVSLSLIIPVSLCFNLVAVAQSGALDQPIEVAGAKASAQQAEDLTDISFESLMEMPVQGASRFEQPLSEAPASVSIITADQIRKFGYRNLADILRSLRGFYITYDRYTSYVGVRGFGRTGDYNSRILVLVDGHRTNDNIFDSVGLGNDFGLDVDLIDRVEVIRGPSSSIYGDNAFFAVINIISRTGHQMNGLEVSGEAGSLDTYKGRVSYGKRFSNGLDAVLSGSILDSRGDSRLFFKEFNDPDHNNGIANNLDGERAYTLFGSLDFKGITFTGGYVRREKHIPTASFFTTFNDPRYREVDSGGYLDLKYEHTYGDDWEVMGRAFFDNREFILHAPVSMIGATSVLNRDSDRNNWIGTEIQVTKTLLDKHRLLIGGEFQHNFTIKFENHDINPYFQYLNIKRTSDKWGLFLQDEYTILPSLILNAGVRYDHFESFGGNVSPRLALIHTPIAGTTLKLLYGEAFRAPNAFELYYDIPQLLQANPNLQPEKITSYELILEQSLGEHLRLIATAFYNKIHNIIVQDSNSDGVLVYKNRGEVSARGAELEIEGKWPGGLEGRVSYTYQDGRDDDGNARLVNSPQHMAKANLIVPLYRDKIFGSAELQYLSSRLTLQGNESGDVFVTNLTLFSRKLLKGLELSGSIYNLFDKRYSDPAGGEHVQDVLVQDGRIFRLKLTYAF